MASSPESYLVRIYRRDEQAPRRIAGLVEIIERERTEAFKNADELMNILGICSGNNGGRSEKKES